MAFCAKIKNMKKIKLLIILIGLLIGTFFIFQKLNHQQEIFCPRDVKECPDGSFVSRIFPNCEFAPCPGEKEGILVSLPKSNSKIKSPLKIEGKAKGDWFFEAVFSAELYDENQKLLGKTNLRALNNWMTNDFVPFEGELIYQKPSTSKGILKFLSANPSGLKKKQKIFKVPVVFEDTLIMKVLLYYYNPLLDQDESGNIKCSESGLVAIEKEIPLTKTPIQDTLNLLLKGKENLTEEQMNKGITTEFPLEGVALKEVNLKPDGTLILKFDDPLNKTSGGSCRVGILYHQIEKTAKQFKEVKKIEIIPEKLFQP